MLVLSVIELGGIGIVCEKERAERKEEVVS